MSNVGQRVVVRSGFVALCPVLSYLLRGAILERPDS